MNKFYGYDRNALLTTAASMPNLDASCAYIQEMIGQDDGGVAGIFFSDDDRVIDYEMGGDSRFLALSDYLDFEYSIT